MFDWQPAIQQSLLLEPGQHCLFSPTQQNTWVDTKKKKEKSPFLGVQTLNRCDFFLFITTVTTPKVSTKASLMVLSEFF